MQDNVANVHCGEAHNRYHRYSYINKYIYIKLKWVYSCILHKQKTLEHHLDKLKIIWEYTTNQRHVTSIHNTVIFHQPCRDIFPQTPGVFSHLSFPNSQFPGLVRHAGLEPPMFEGMERSQAIMGQVWSRDGGGFPCRTVLALEILWCSQNFSKLYLSNTKSAQWDQH